VCSTGRALFVPVKRHLEATIGEKAKEELADSVYSKSTG